MVKKIIIGVAIVIALFLVITMNISIPNKAVAIVALLAGGYAMITYKPSASTEDE